MERQTSGAAGGMPPPPKRISQLDEVLDTLAKNIACLTAVIEQLEHRLIPVLIPKLKLEVDQVGVPPDDPPIAPLVSAFRQKQDNIYALTASIEDLLARLIL